MQHGTRANPLARDPQLQTNNIFNRHQLLFEDLSFTIILGKRLGTNVPIVMCRHVFSEFMAFHHSSFQFSNQRPIKKETPMEDLSVQVGPYLNHVIDTRKTCRLFGVHGPDPA